MFYKKKKISLESLESFESIVSFESLAYLENLENFEIHISLAGFECLEKSRKCLEKDCRTECFSVLLTSERTCIVVQSLLNWKILQLRWQNHFSDVMLKNNLLCSFHDFSLQNFQKLWILIILQRGIVDRNISPTRCYGKLRLRISRISFQNFLPYWFGIITCWKYLRSQRTHIPHFC